MTRLSVLVAAVVVAVSMTTGVAGAASAQPFL
jgi:hypothetical protein